MSCSQGAGGEVVGAADDVAPQSSEARLFPLDFIRATAICLVIILHSASPLMYQIGSVPIQVWTMHNFVDSFARICVPLFFLITGYLLLPPTRSAEQPIIVELRRRLLKIALPLVVWSLFYRFRSAYLNTNTLTIHDVYSSMIAITQNGVVYHLSFLYEMTTLYLLVPLLRRFFRPDNKPALYFAGLWLFFLAAKMVSSVSGWAFPFAHYVDFGNSGYLVAGALLRRYASIPDRKMAFAALAVQVVATLATFEATQSLSQYSGAYVERFHIYASLNVALMSISAFIFLIYISRKIKKLKLIRVIFGAIGVNSFGIYFVHVYFLENIYYDVIGRPAAGAAGALYHILATAGYTLAASFAVTWCLRRFGITRWLAP